MASNNLVSVISVSDFTNMAAEIEADVTAKQAGGKSVVSTSCFHAVDSSDGSPKWITVITYNNAGGGDKSFLMEVAAGKVPGKSVAGLFGRNSDIDTGTVPETIGGIDGLWAPTPSPEKYDIVSTSVDDAVAGTGATALFIAGLDANFDEINEIVPLTGTVSVETANTYSRINSVVCVSAGSDGRNQGDISVTSVDTTSIQAIVKTNRGQAQRTIFTVPRGKFAYFYDYFASFVRAGGTSGAMAVICLELRSVLAGSIWLTGYTHSLSVTGSSIAIAPFRPPIIIPEMTDLVVNCDDVTDNNADITAAFTLILEEI